MAGEKILLLNEPFNFVSCITYAKKKKFKKRNLKINTNSVSH